MNQPTFNSWTDLYLFTERLWNAGSPSGFGQEVPPEYRRRFDLPVLWIPPDNLVAVGDTQRLRMIVEAHSPIPGLLPLPVHPTVYQECRETRRLAEEVTYWDVSATATGRTVLAHQLAPGRDAGVFLKLHYPKILGRFPRPLNLRQCAASVLNSSSIMRLNWQEQFRPAVSFMDEFAFVYSEFGRFGSIFRSTLPLVAEGRPHPNLVPFHALNFQADGCAPCLDWLFEIGHLPNDSVEVATILVRPWLRSFAFLASRGLIPEWHGQNCLLAIHADGPTLVPAARDLGDFFIDHALAQAGEPSCNYKEVGLGDSDRFQRRSFAYDYKLGRYLIDPTLIAITLACPGSSVPELQELVRSWATEAWDEVGLDIRTYFGSNSWFGYPQSASVGRRDYVSMPGSPTYR